MKTLDAGHVLARILEVKRRRVEEAKLRVPEAIVRKMADTALPVPSFREALAAETGTRIIAEVKKTSPSAGVLCPDLDVARTSRAYAAAGAAAISVVTEEDFFQGSLRWVREAGAASGLPVIRKDFVYDPYQVYETRAAGASAILLIAAMLDAGELQHLVRLSAATGLDALVEVHDAAELEEALGAGASMIGVNNRDLKTFDVRLETAVELGARIPDGVVFVAESGIRSRADIERLGAAGADAFLVGEQLIRSPDPGRALEALL